MNKLSWLPYLQMKPFILRFLSDERLVLEQICQVASTTLATKKCAANTTPSSVVNVTVAHVRIALTKLNQTLVVSLQAGQAMVLTMFNGCAMQSLQ